MKKSYKIVMGAFILSMLFSISSLSNTFAAEVPLSSSDGTPSFHQIQANNRTTFRYQQQTQLTINCTQDCDLLLSCEAIKIGEKIFEIEITAVSDLEINMTCTEEQAESGLLLGSRHTVRNQNRYLYQEAFCVSLECNTSFTQAKLMIQATAQNGAGVWAYYDEANQEWVSVPTETRDGYLIATTDHFSTWTILIPEINYLPYIIATVAIIVGLVAAISIVGIVIYTKKR